MRSIARIYYFLNPYHNVELNTFQALQECNTKKKKKKKKEMLESKHFLAWVCIRIISVFWLLLQILFSSI